MEENNHIQSALDAGSAVGAQKVVGPGSSYAVIPKDYRLESLENFEASPNRKRGNVVLTDEGSFHIYVNRHKTPDTTVFCNAAIGSSGSVSVSIRAVLDFHGPFEPHWCAHEAVLECEKTPEWNAIAGKSNVYMSQTDFANFLETYQTSVVNPNGADLLELCSTLEGKKNVSFKTGIRLKDGRQQIQYDEDIEVRGSSGTNQANFNVPSEIEFGVSPFFNGQKYRVKARLRYRIEDRKITFCYSLVEVHLVLQDAVKGITDRLTEKCGLVALMGRFNKVS